MFGDLRSGKFVYCEMCVPHILKLHNVVLTLLRVCAHLLNNEIVAELTKSFECRFGFRAFVVTRLVTEAMSAHTLLTRYKVLGTRY